MKIKTKAYLVGFIYCYMIEGVKVAPTGKPAEKKLYRLIKVGKAIIPFMTSEAVTDEQWVDKKKDLVTNLRHRIGLRKRWFADASEDMSNILSIPIFATTSSTIFDASTWRKWATEELASYEEKVLRQQLLGTDLSTRSLLAVLEQKRRNGKEKAFPATELRVGDMRLPILQKVCTEMKTKVDPTKQWACFEQLVRCAEKTTYEADFSVSVLGETIPLRGQLFDSIDLTQFELELNKVVARYADETGKHETSFHYLDVERSKLRPRQRAQYDAEPITPPGGARQRERSSPTSRAAPKARKRLRFDDRQDTTRPAGSNESEPPCKPKPTKVVSVEPTRVEQPRVGRNRSTDSVTRQEAPADHAPSEKTRAASTTTPPPRKRSKTPPPRERSRTKATGSPQPGAKKNEERQTQTHKRKREVLPGHFKRKQKADAAEATTPVDGLGTPDNKLTNAALEHNREPAIGSRAASVRTLRPQRNLPQMSGVAFLRAKNGTERDYVGRPTGSGPTSVGTGNGATGRHASIHRHDAVDAGVDRPGKRKRANDEHAEASLAKGTSFVAAEPSTTTSTSQRAGQGASGSAVTAAFADSAVKSYLAWDDRLLSFAPEDVEFICREWYQLL